MAKKTVGGELSHLPDRAATKLQLFFAEAKKELEAKLVDQFGQRFLDDFMGRLRAEVDRIPTNIREKTNQIIQETVQHTIAGIKGSMAAAQARVDAEQQRVWGDFIQKEIDKRIYATDTIVAVAKKVKELSSLGG